ncbi:MAG: transketolase [Deltaproteobacteria bacterium]|nr:transketolase [Deltaproteobacteria bacterium]
MQADDNALAALSQKLRRDSLLSTSEAGSGHPTTCLSAAEIMATLFFREMALDARDPWRPGTDHFVMSKGHAAPILWSALKELGAITHDTSTLRQIDSPLEGHPTPRVPGWVKVATGSLGQGLSAAMGMAVGRRIAGDPGRIYCLLGDGETAEGSVWEAAALAAYYKLGNLCAIVDVNGLGQSGRTMHERDTEALCGKFRAFGWHAIGVDGHDLAALTRAFEEARREKDKPTAILARTLKGKGVRLLEDKDNWHGKPLKKGEELDTALAEVGAAKILFRVEARTRGTAAQRPQPSGEALPPPPYKMGEQVATREAYGEALVRIGTLDPRIVVLDAETKNSTFAEKFKDRFPERFVECFIAEQNMVGAALGLAGEGFVPFASTFAAFLTRAYDFIRMAAYSTPKHLILVGSHVGVSIGEDGPSQMGLEDLAMMRAVMGSTVLYPSDAMSASRLVEQAISTGGIVYLRTSRPKTRVIYGPDEQFPVGGCKVIGQSPRDVATVVAAGVTLNEALTARERLGQEGISIRVVDLYSVKPLDVATLQRCADETSSVITVEDHFPWGGIGEAIASQVVAPRLEMLAVRDLPRSGKPAELLARHKLDASAIVEAVKRVRK